MRRLVSFLASILFFVIGCTTAAPYLEPVREEKIPEGKEYITVYVRPVYTKGFFSEDKKRYGIDLSSYFTAFDIKIVNKTEKTIKFDTGKVEIIDSGKIVHNPLSENEGAEYYKSGGSDPGGAIVLLPKARKVVEEDTEKIRKISMAKETIIKKGEEKGGILLFKKLKEESCKGIILKVTGITIEELKEGREFEFRFICPN